MWPGADTVLTMLVFCVMAAGESRQLMAHNGMKLSENAQGRPCSKASCSVRPTIAMFS